MSTHDHGHEHEQSPQALRAEALESLLKDKGLLEEADIDAVIERYNERVGPMNGARLVARAWTDPGFRTRLLDDATAVVREFDFEGGEVQKLIVAENTEDTHNVVVCTLCSCYPWAVLGLPPRWYKDPAYRSRIVREPRTVLSEMGLDVPADTTIRVWDSSAEVRYMVLPRRPAGTESMSEDELAELVTRDSMIGVAEVESRVGGRMNATTDAAGFGLEGALEPPLENGELVFEAPWQGRVFGMARALCESGVYSWDEFRAALIREIGAADAARERGESVGEYAYYDHFLAALESLLAERDLVDDADLAGLVAVFAARGHGHDH